MKKYLHCNSALLIILILLYSESNGFSSTQSLILKQIGYSAIQGDLLINDIESCYSEAVLNSLNDLGMVKLKYVDVEQNFKRPDIQQIVNLCEQFNLDAFLIGKISLKRVKAQTFIDMVNGKPRELEGLKIELKLIDNKGNFSNDQYFSYAKSSLKMDDLDNEIQQGVSVIINELSKKWKIIDSDFAIENLVNKNWVSFKFLNNKMEFHPIHLESKLHLYLTAKSRYYVDLSSHLARRTPIDSFIYNSSRKELVLHTKTEDLAFLIVGFNDSLLVLRPGSMNNFRNIYFRQLGEKEIEAIINPRKLDTIMANRSMRSYKSDGPIYFVVKESATFQGGDLNDFRLFIEKKIIYPSFEYNNDFSGKTIVQFVIGYDGYIKDIEIVRTSGFINLDKEALRVLKASPIWKPGRQGGKAVNQLFTMPVSFVIQ